MAGTFIQVGAVLLLALLAGSPRSEASPRPGLASLLAPSREPRPQGEQGAPATINPATIPQRIIGGLFSRGQPASAPAAQPQHHDAPAKKPEAPAPTAAASTTTTTAATSTSTSSSSTTAAAVAASTTATPTEAAPRSGVPTSTAAPASAEAKDEESTRAEGQGGYSKEQLEKCRQNYLQVTNSTVSESLDIQLVLLDNGGLPGQLTGAPLKWERNATSSHPNRWTYFYGDTDYRTFIRSERGEVNSKTYPAQGVVPEAVSGDIYWSPDDFCGKLRHAKYTQELQELRASNQPKVCFIDGDRVVCWNAPECVEPLEPGVTCPRGGASAALMASLVG